MSDDKDLESFFDNLKPLVNHFDKSFSEDEEVSMIEQELLEVEARYSEGVQIDQGGMKSIASVTDNKTLRNVARATLISPTIQNNERFISEARLTAFLEHPNIVPVYDLDFDEEKGELFFTMKMIEGENLADLIKSMADGKRQCTTSELVQIFLK
ncbi:MAG: hypothetical protein NE330_17460, partial [Lentisphaeraceae bacterium]|nr:hypothetical protein [Lentisphaeraceae bacterium]